MDGLPAAEVYTMNGACRIIDTNTRARGNQFDAMLKRNKVTSRNFSAGAPTIGITGCRKDIIFCLHNDS